MGRVGAGVQVDAVDAAQQVAHVEDVGHAVHVAVQRRGPGGHVARVVAVAEQDAAQQVAAGQIPGVDPGVAAAGWLPARC